MAAGLGFKTFAVGEVLTAADTNGYLMQGVLVFASAAARDAAITSPQEGQFAYTKDTNGLWYYDGAAWVASGATGDIEGVTAGTGISGGGTSGTVTITNSMATAIDAKGDLVVGTGADTFSKLTVGANDTVLTADSSTATGLKWASASAGGKNFVLLNSGGTALSGSTTTISGISAKDQIFVVISGYSASSYAQAILTVNSSSSNYRHETIMIESGSVNVYERSDGMYLGQASSNSNSYGYGSVLISGCNSSGVKVFQTEGGFNAGGGSGQRCDVGGGTWTDSATISSVSITSTSGNWDAGTIYVYTTA